MADRYSGMELLWTLGFTIFFYIISGVCNLVYYDSLSLHRSSTFSLSLLPTIWLLFLFQWMCVYIWVCVSVRSSAAMLFASAGNHRLLAVGCLAIPSVQITFVFPLRNIVFLPVVSYKAGTHYVLAAAPLPSTSTPLMTKHKHKSSALSNARLKKASFLTIPFAQTNPNDLHCPQILLSTV